MHHDIENKDTNTTPWIGPHGQYMERLELHVTYHCPEKCMFCSEEHRMNTYRSFPVTWGRVAKTLRLHASRGVKNVHFTGGEPSIHPKFIDILALAKKLRMRTSLGTIGTMLSRWDFAQKAFPLLDEGLFSVHGPNAQIHDGLTRRKGSFETVSKAMQHASLFPHFSLFANTVLTQQNVDVLPDTVSYLVEQGAKLIVISNTTPEGAGEDHYKNLAVPLQQLRDIIPKTVERAQDVILRFFGVPMCILGEYFSLSNDLHWDPRVTVEWQSQPNKVVFDGIYSWKPDRRRVHVDACGVCRKKEICMGVFDEFVQHFSIEELEPTLL